MNKYKRKNWVGLSLLLPLTVAILLAHHEWASPCRAEGEKASPSKSRLEGQVSHAPKTIVDLQPFRETSSIKIKDVRGEEGLATLINLNPNINAWYLLRLKWPGTLEEDYHLENAHPKSQRFLLDNNHPEGLVIVEKENKNICNLWEAKFSYSLKEAKGTRAAYAPLCGGKLYLRNRVKGHRTGIEMATDVLRDEVPGGERIVGFVRDTFFKYLYQQKAEEKIDSKPMVGLPQKETNHGPMPALIDPKKANRSVKPNDLGIDVQKLSPNGLVLGSWYAAKENPGIYVSLIVPGGIAPEILHSYRKVVSELDSIEAEGLVYLVAFDLDQFGLKYALGTEHPRVGWSDHVLSQMMEKSLPGPDGIGNIAPLVSTGLINPMDEGRTVVSFTGGFKRVHGAFRYGELALKNYGSHYGFLENGVIFSRLETGLATIYVLEDGRVDMKTWTQSDDPLLPKIKYARQNGVPLIIEFDQVAQMSVPGPLISRWGEGNWSGSADKKLRTLRAGLALQEFSGRRFLIYAFFWSATPSAMARVFQAYRCHTAMLLDMNALEHTYLALYRRQGSNLYVQHLIQGMSEVDVSTKGKYIPRFLGYSDDRDFFYLTRKEAP
ncbi:MAG TPA: hypothetical protein VK551_11225 [Thermodesulfobacteriota bacterium]|nr:hypothetical protein [Thermodesulfobacteriota bacterium]